MVRVRGTKKWASVAMAASSLALCLTGSAAALEPLPPGRFPFRTYGTADGLGNLSVMRLAQDRTGFLWAATQDGLFRYDGARFRRFGSEDGLPSTYLSDVDAAPDGSLWCNTYAGVVRFDGQRGTPARGLPARMADDVTVAPGGAVWAAYPDALYRSTGDAFAPVMKGASTAITADTNAVLAAVGGSLIRFEGTVPSVVATLPSRVDAVRRDATGTIWVRSGTHLWRLAGTVFVDESHNLPGTSNSGYLALDRSGNLWVPTDRGIAVNERGTWRLITGANGLPVLWSRDVLQDHEGSIWIGSLGVHRMLGRGAFVNHTVQTGLPNEVIWVFHRDRQGRLLVGTDLGLARAGKETWTVLEGTEESAIRSVAEDSDGSLWAGGSPAEMLHYDERSPAGLRTERYGEKEGVVARRILAVRVTNDGTVWAGTLGGGLLQKPRGAKAFSRVPLPNGLPDERVSGLLVDRGGRLWAAGDQGLAVRAGGVWHRFARVPGFTHDHIAYLTEASSGYWGAYFESVGLVNFRLADRGGAPSIEVVRTLTTAEGLSAGKIYLIGEDSQRRLWIGSSLGVDVLEGDRIRHFGAAEGLAGDDTDAMAFLSDAGANVFIGTSSGFTHTNARLQPPPLPVPAVAILSAEAGRHALDLRAASQVDAPRRDRNLVVQYAALTYASEAHLEYQHRLAADEDWNTTTEREAGYNALDPGAYRFEVRARVDGGLWSDPAVVSFEIQPAFSETTTAHVLAVLAVLALLFALYRWRVAILRRRTVELERLVDQRTRELADANAQLTNLSVTDALTGMKNRRYLLHAMPEAAAEALRKHEVAERSGLDTARSNADLLLLMIDLDHFKNVNDRYGHLAGDQILVAFHDLLRAQLRESDTITRWGGEEFLVVARNASRADASLLAERIRSAVESHEFTTSAGVVKMTCSIGFAPFPFLELDRARLRWEDVVELADSCLYEAKRSGRNRWVGIGAGDVRSAETLVARSRESLLGVARDGEVVLQTRG